MSHSVNQGELMVEPSFPIMQWITRQTERHREHAFATICCLTNQLISAALTVPAAALSEVYHVV